jgi:hypothetical protein
MKKIFLIPFFICPAFIAKAQNDIVVDANASLRTLSGQFDAIKVSGGIDLYLSQSDRPAIAVSASSEDYKEGIKTEIDNGTLKIFYDGEKSWKKKDRKLRVYVSFSDLKKIDASGACDVLTAGSIASPDLSIHMSGASDFTGQVKVTALKINLSGASDLRISGTAVNVDIISSGASDVKGYELVTDTCTANVSGASDVNITINAELTASASGASDIKYKGNAVIKDKHSSGASSISKAN